MTKVLFRCHGSTSDSRELAAFVGLKRGKSGQLGKWVTTVILRVRKRKKSLCFKPFFRDLVFGFTSLGRLLRFCKQAFPQKHCLAVGKA